MFSMEETGLWPADILFNDGLLKLNFTHHDV